MAANHSRDRGNDLRRYRFIVGVTLAALEDDVNRVVHDDPRLCLFQVFYATGTGFVGVLECPGDLHVPTVKARTPEPAQNEEEIVKIPEKGRKKR